MNMQFNDLLAIEDRSYTIGELSKSYGISLRTIRFYEEKGLLTPQRRGTNRRTYSVEDVRRLDFIVSCRQTGIAVDAIAMLLDVKDKLTTDTFHSALTRQLRKRLAELDAEKSKIEEQRHAVMDWIGEMDGADGN